MKEDSGPSWGIVMSLAGTRSPGGEGEEGRNREGLGGQELPYDVHESLGRQPREGDMESAVNLEL